MRNMSKAAGVKKGVCMGLYLNPGNKSFENVLRSGLYVDKTGLLNRTNAVLDTEFRFICVSRPRRFGKSVAAKMLSSYYCKGCDSSGLFKGLEISASSGYRDHMNQYNVIHLDLNVFLHSKDNMYGGFYAPIRAVDHLERSVISELEQEFSGSGFPDTNDLAAALSDIYRRSGEQFIVIIDEWDALFRENKFDKEAQDYYIKLLRRLFKDFSGEYIRLAYLTGVLPIKKYGTQSALNNFKEYTMIEPFEYAPYVGFNEEEVKTLCEENDIDFEQMERWYDGYKIKDMHIYNPNSVIDAVLHGEVTSYWSKTDTYEVLSDYIGMNFEGLKDCIIGMLGGGRHPVNTANFTNDMVSFNSGDDVLTLLVHLGYLTYNEYDKTVMIPNEEVRKEFIAAIERQNWDKTAKAISDSAKLLNETLAGNEAFVAEMIDSVHSDNTSVLKYNDENSLACTITLAYYKARDEYKLIRELPAGRGFADIVFLPRRNTDKPVLVVELKWDKTAEGAIAQIKEKGYVKAVEDYTGRILLIGINYDKDSKKHECRIEEFTRTDGRPEWVTICQQEGIKPEKYTDFGEAVAELMPIVGKSKSGIRKTELYVRSYKFGRDIDPDIIESVAEQYR